MTAVLLTPLTGQFFDNNGDPLSGGLVYSYLAGTLTPQATYTDATGVTPAANPVVLNSAGRADIWGSGTYKFIIKDSLGNTLDTIDSVTATFGTGDMTKAVYDPANIAQQVVGTTATQTLTNKTLSASVNVLALTPISNSLSADVALNNTANYFDGPTVAQGVAGVWFVSGTVTVVDTVGAAQCFAKLWDGTTVIASCNFTPSAASQPQIAVLSGYIANPAGNLRISVRDASSTNGIIRFNATGLSKDSTITAFKIG